MIEEEALPVSSTAADIKAAFIQPEVNVSDTSLVAAVPRPVHGAVVLQASSGEEITFNQEGEVAGMPKRLGEGYR